MSGSGLAKQATICGAGIAGLTAALTLARSGIETVVLERAEVLGEVGAGLQISPNAMHVLNALGLDEAIRSVGFEPEASCIRDHKTGQVLLDLPLKEICQTRYGARYVHIHRADLHGILLHAAKKAGAQILLNQSAIGYTQTADKTHLQTDKGVYEADILIGADGLRSKLRDTMLGPEPPAFTGQVAWRGTVPARSLPHDLVAPNATVWVGPHHHFVTYYIKSGRLLNFVAVQERADWTDTSWTQKGDISELRAAFSGWHPEIQTILGATQDCYLWALFGRDPLPTWCDRRVALAGDAAHPMLPFMAQGAAMAMEDAWVLGQCLKTAPVREALRHYEAIRKPRATMVQEASRSNAKLFHRRAGAGDLWQRAKLRVAGLLPQAAIHQLDKIYGVNVTKS